jgi:hypothetical protein
MLPSQRQKKKGRDLGNFKQTIGFSENKTRTEK